jgi:hypothetical protein
MNEATVADSRFSSVHGHLFNGLALQLSSLQAHAPDVSML